MAGAKTTTTRRHAGGPHPAPGRTPAPSKAHAQRAALRRLMQDAPARAGVEGALAGRGKPLAQPVRQAAERRLGAPLGEVRLHADTRADQASRDVHARAFALGRHIVLGREALAAQASPLAHELVHVAQRRDAAREGEQKAPGERGQPAEREAEQLSRHMLAAGAPLRLQERLQPFAIARQEPETEKEEQAAAPEKKTFGPGELEAATRAAAAKVVGEAGPEDRLREALRPGKAPETKDGKEGTEGPFKLEEARGSVTGKGLNLSLQGRWLKDNVGVFGKLKTSGAEVKEVGGGVILRFRF